MNNVQEVLSLAASGLTINEAIEKFEKDNGPLSPEERQVLLSITDEELKAIVDVENRVKAGVPGVAGHDGGIF